MSRTQAPGSWPPVWLVPALAPLSWLYQTGLSFYLAPYELGIRKQHQLGCRVVCVGNLTFGGTGKSPMVRAICREIQILGLRPAVLSRGHGGRMCLAGGLVSDGEKRLMEAVDSGDEPALLADSLPGVPVAIGKDRGKSGEMVIERFSPDIIVLDDGMQYWQLHRDADIVLVSAVDPFGNGWVLPAGTLREPVSGISRASAVVVTGAEAVSRELAVGVAEQMKIRAPEAEVFIARREPTAVIDTRTGEQRGVETLRGMKVVAVSGIANPQSFESALERLGADIAARVRFGDHAEYSQTQIDTVRKALKDTGAVAVVTTAKDAVKYRIPEGLLVLDMNMVVENMDRLVRLVIGNMEVAGVE